MNITCDSLDQLVEVCILLLKEGVGFDANADQLTIELTGAY